MKRTDIWHRGRGEGQKIHNETQLCHCPACGYSQPHIPGIPCRTETCPVCKVSLVRSTQGKADEKNVNKTIDKNSGKGRPYIKENPDIPHVTPEICTGCGVCIENCPVQAIELMNGKAFIKEDECTNCRLCESLCSFGAIE